MAKYLGITKLDSWQKKVLEIQDKSMVIVSPRQMGKSTIIGIHAGEFAVKNPKKSIMIISAVERQAYLLFEKVLAYIHDNYPLAIKKSRDNPTKQKLQLKNGSIIRCLPTGLDGYGIRGYTINRLYADEAALINRDVWAAVTPSLATTGGQIILLSTPMGTEGYFYEAYNSPRFVRIHVDPEEVLSERPKEVADRMREFRLQEKESLTRLEYLQEYEGKFVTDLKQFFPDELIRNCMVRERQEKNRDHPIYLGVDVAGKGTDETTYEIFQRNEGKIYQIENLAYEGQIKTTQITRDIISLDQKFRFNRIGIDDGGVGYGVWSELSEDPRTKRKTVGLNNASKPLNQRPNERKKPLKEIMYFDLKREMEKGNIELLKDSEIFKSLKSIQIERSKQGNLVITGKYSHIAEGIIRAVHLAKKKRLNIWVRWN